MAPLLKGCGAVFGLCSDAWEVCMEANKSCLERAFEIARSGRAPNFLYLLNKLKSEGYGHDQIYGPVLKKQLSDLIEKAKAS
jgi:hypothetical protein